MTARYRCRHNGSICRATGSTAYLAHPMHYIELLLDTVRREQRDEIRNVEKDRHRPSDNCSACYGTSDSQSEHCTRTATAHAIRPHWTGRCSATKMCSGSIFDI